MFTRTPGVLFEAVAEAPGGDGGEAVESAEIESAEVGDLADEQPAEPQAAEPDYEAMLRTPEGQQALERAIYEQMQGFQQYEEEPQQDADPFANLDFLADDAPQQLAAILEQNNQRLLEAINGSPAIAHAEEAHHKEWASSEFSRIEQSIGAQIPDNLREMAITMAAGNRPPEGHPDLRYFDPTRALHDSASQLHSLIQSERAAAVREYQTGVAGGADQQPGGEPSATGVAAVHSEAEPGNMREAREAWERRQGLR